MTLNITAMGPPKINKNASKSKKKSWRKNIDMTEAEEALEEKRFEERVGGSFEARESKDLFMLDSEGIDPAVKKEKKKRGEKPIKAWSLLNGLGGAPDPHPNRNRVRTKERKEQNKAFLPTRKKLLKKTGS